MTSEQREARFQAVVADYYQALDAGETPDRDGLLRDNPALADDLRAVFDGDDRAARMAEPIRAGRPQHDQTLKRPHGDLSPTWIHGHAAAMDSLPRGRFGDYDILEELARGGMGVVFRARQVSLDRIVAVKMILGGLLHSQWDLMRFRMEAEAAARLDHPNIVPIYEVGEVDGRPYFSMKLIEGGSLAGLLTSKRWPTAGAESERRAAQLVATVARAVQHAHQHGILHRDLKPGNILLQEGARSQNSGARMKTDGASTPGSWLLTSDFSPYVTDFGLAKHLEQDSELTQSGAVLGTPNYMAPEQAAGQRNLTTAADIYSLGVILFELITGRKPFQAESGIDLLIQIREREALSPRLVRPETSRDLETICLKCLEKGPTARYTSAAALADDLERFLAGDAILARPTRLWERALKWAKRRPAVAALAGSLAFVSVAAFLLVLWQWRVAVEQYDRAEVERLRATRAEQQAMERAEAEAAAHRKSRQLLYLSQVARARQEWATDRKDSARKVLMECDADMRRFEWFYLANLYLPATMNSVHVLRGHEGNVVCLAFHRDGKITASGGADGTIRLWDIVAGRELAVLKGGGGIHALAFVPDGRLAACDGRKLSLWNIDKKEIVEDHAVPNDTADYRLSADGTHFAALLKDGRIHLWDIKERRANELEAVPRAEGRLYVSPTASVLAVPTKDGLQIVNPGLARQAVLPLPEGQHVRLVTFRPDGKEWVELLSLSTRVRDATGKILHTIDSGGQVGDTCAAYSPKGDLIAVAGSNDRISTFDAASAQLKADFAGQVDVRALGFTPGGQTLVSGGRDIRVWQAELPGRIRLKRRDTFCNAHFTGDGRYLVSITEDPAALGVWATTTYRLIETLQPRHGVLKRLAGDAEGHWLAAAGEGGVVLFRDFKEAARIPAKEVNALEFHPHQPKLLIAGEGRCRILSVPDGKELVAWPCQDKKAAFHPQGDIVASLGTRLTLWDAATGARLSSHAGSRSEVLQMSFHPSGDRLIVVNQDGAYLVDTNSGEATKIALGDHAGFVKAARFSREGDRLFIARFDGTIHVLDAATMQEVLTLKGGGLLTDLTVHPRGEALASTSNLPSVLEVWPAPPQR